MFGHRAKKTKTVSAKKKFRNERPGGGVLLNKVMYGDAPSLKKVPLSDGASTCSKL